MLFLSLTSCSIEEVCEDAVLTAEPGRIVTVEGERHLELVARFEHEGRPVVGATLEFGFDWERAALLVADVDTDATGTSTFRTSFSDMELDVRMKGAFKEPWLVRYDNQNEVGGVAYCEARATGSLPLADLPQPRGDR